MARRGSRLVVINSYKNVIDTIGGLVGAVVSNTDVAIAVQPGSLVTTGNQVPIGGKITSIYYSIYAKMTDVDVIGLMDMYWWKNQAGQLTAPVPGNTGISEGKRYIFHEEKGLSGDDGSTPMVVKGVIKIPSRYQRFGNGDELQFRIVSGNSGFFCAKHIYRVIY